VLTGLSLTLLNSVLLACLGVVFQRVARRGIAILPFCALASAFSLILCAPAVRWGALMHGGAAGLAGLTAVMLASGVANAGAVGCGIAAMRLGHSAVTFVVAQSAMALTFLYSVLGWGEPASAYQLAGLALALAMLWLVAPASGGAPQQPAAARSAWLPLVLTAFALGGLAQVLYMTPARWAGWQDAARLRAPLFMAGMVVAYVLPAAARRQGPRRGMVALAAVQAVLITVSAHLLILAIDSLTPLHLEGLVYPVTIAAGLLLYSAYSHLFLQEATAPRQKWGMLAGAAGLVLLCVR
jgi:hypothetical protein